MRALYTKGEGVALIYVNPTARPRGSGSATLAMLRDNTGALLMTTIEYIMVGLLFACIAAGFYIALYL